MLKKLLKYDIKGTSKNLIPFYGIVLLLSVLVRLSGIIKEHFPITGFINAMMLLFFIIAVIAIVFYTFFVAIRRFYQTVLKDEGYLTNTLPVKRSNIILSQILTALIFIITSIIVMASSLFIAFYSKENFKYLIDFTADLSLMGTKPWVAYSYAGIMLLLSYITYIIVFILALILGHQKSKNKIAYSFMYGIIIYCILQVISLLALGIAIIFDNNLIEVMNRTNVLFNEIIPIFIATGISSLITPFIGYLLSCKFINTKLNLE